MSLNIYIHLFIVVVVVFFSFAVFAYFYTYPTAVQFSLRSILLFSLLEKDFLVNIVHPINMIRSEQIR